MRKVLFALPVMIALAGCATTGSTSNTIAITEGAAEASYQTIYVVWAQKVTAGQMTRARFQELNAQAYASLLLARTAKTVADVATAKAQIAALPTQ